MANETAGVFEVKCPCCGAALQIDAELQIVLRHREPERKPAIEDLQAAVQQLKGQSSRLDEAFEKSFASHRSGEKIREKKFEELLKQAKEEPTGTPPPRPFDLD